MPSGGVGTEVLRVDLEPAGIPYRDGDGRIADFHALRHTFITNLAIPPWPAHSGYACFAEARLRDGSTNREFHEGRGQTRLAVAYSPEAPPDLPRRFFLKMGGEATEQRVVTAPNRQREVRFHVEVVPAMADPPVVPCYDAVFSERTGESHLLFRDVSGTHVSVQGQPSPATPQCRRIAEAFGRFHAHWWGHPALGELGDLPSRESVSRDIDSSRQCFPEFASKAADLLSSNELQLYDRVLASLTDLWQRADDRRNLTLIHGDAHFGNVLVPRDARQHGALLVDWQLWNVNWGTDDLANLMALHWSPETRQRLERDLLGVYYNTLAAHGVQAYTWSDCWQDYRLSVVTRVLLMPMWERLGGVPTNAWQADLGRALSAFRDLGCEDLLSM